MNTNPKNGREDLPLDRVVRQLHAINAVEPPSSLREKLLAGVPAVAQDGPITCRVRPAWQGIQWAGAAAAVLVVASVVVWLGEPWGRHAPFTADANSSRRPAYATDMNSLRPSDTNLYDTNSLR